MAQVGLQTPVRWTTSNLTAGTTAQTSNLVGKLKVKLASKNQLRLCMFDPSQNKHISSGVSQADFRKLTAISADATKLAKVDQKTQTNAQQILNAAGFDSTATQNLTAQERVELASLVGQGRLTANFMNKYTAVMDEHAPSLKAAPEAMLRTMLEMARGGCPLADHSSSILDSPALQARLAAVEDMAGDADDGDVNKLKTVVTDMLTFASLVPTKRELFATTGDRIGTVLTLGQPRMHQRLATVDTISHNQIVRRLDELAEAGDLGATERLSHLDGETYQDASALQRMLLMSLNGLNPSLRDDVIEGAQFQKILARDDLMTWMFAASGPTRQEYLNSCAGAALSADIMGHAASIDVLSKVGWETYNHFVAKLTSEAVEEVVSQPAWDGGPSIKEVAGRRLEKTRVELEGLDKRIAELADKDDPVSRQELTRLNQDWSKAMQRLFSLAEFSESSTISLQSGKPLGDMWLSSGALTVLGHGLAKMTSKNQPTLNERLEYGTQSWPGADKALKDIIELSAPNLQKASNDERELRFDKLNKYDASAREAFGQKLWTTVDRSGGALVSRPGHALHLKTTVLNGKPAFALQDPLNTSEDRFFSPKAFANFLAGKGDWAMHFDYGIREEQANVRELQKAGTKL